MLLAEVFPRPPFLATFGCAYLQSSYLVYGFKRLSYFLNPIPLELADLGFVKDNRLTIYNNNISVIVSGKSIMGGKVFHHAGIVFNFIKCKHLRSAFPFTLRRYSFPDCPACCNKLFNCGVYFRAIRYALAILNEHLANPAIRIKTNFENIF